MRDGYGRSQGPSHGAPPPLPGRPHGQSNRDHGQPVSRNRGGGGGSNTLRRTINRKLRSKKIDNPINPVIKYILFFANFLILLIGIAFVIIGGIVLEQKEKVVSTPLEFFFDPACLLTLVGSVAVVMAFLGCLGPLREIVIVIKIYHIVLTIILIGEIVVIVLIFLMYFVPDARTALKLYPEDGLKEAIVKYRDDQDMEDLINTIQKTFSCCGVSNDDKGYKDWNANKFFNCSDGNLSREKCAVPYSCCIIKEGDPVNLLCGAESLKQDDASLLKDKIYTVGCLKGLELFIHDHALAIGGAIIGILFPQILFICFASALSDQIQEVIDGWQYQRAN